CLPSLVPPFGLPSLQLKAGLFPPPTLLLAPSWGLPWWVSVLMPCNGARFGAWLAVGCFLPFSLALFPTRFSAACKTSFSTPQTHSCKPNALCLFTYSSPVLWCPW